MRRILVVVPAAPSEASLGTRRAQSGLVRFDAETEFEFRQVKANPVGLKFDGHPDWLLQDLAVFEAGADAEEEGFAAVCIDTVSDAGLNLLRSVLDIPVVSPGKASYLMALMLGTRFSILTMWDPWKGMYERPLRDYGLWDKCASIRAINVEPDLSSPGYLEGKEDAVFPRLVEEANRCVEEDGADVICLGSTSMYQSYGYVAERVAVPVINPGPLTYKTAELLLDLGLTHSRAAYGRPRVSQTEVVHAMLEAAAAMQEGHALSVP